MQLNVVHATPVLTPTGAGAKAIRIFAKHLDPHRFKVHICTLSTNKETCGIFEETGLEVFVPQDHQDLATYVRENDIQIMHVYGSGGSEVLPLLTMAKDSGIPIIVRSNFFGIIDPLTVKFIDRELMISKFLAFRAIKLYDQSLHEKIHVLYPPIDFSEVKLHDRNEFRDRFGLSPDVPVVGNIARRDPSKWSFFLIKMAKTLLKRVKRVEFLLVGAPEPMRNLIKREKLEECFRIFDEIPQKEIYKFYNSIDVFAHFAKIGESFGYVIAEAMAYGKPVIVNSTPMRDNAQLEFIRNGINGFVANTPSICAKIISKLVENGEVRKKIGKKARENSKLFDARRITKVLERHYVDMAVNKLKIKHLGPVLRRYKKINYLFDKNELKEFERCYQKALFHCFGADNLKYLFERLAWKITVNSPLSIRRVLYSVGNGLFILADSPSLREQSIPTDIFGRLLAK